MATKTEHKTYTLELDENEYAWIVAGLYRELIHWQDSGETFTGEIEKILQDLGEID